MAKIMESRDVALSVEHMEAFRCLIDMANAAFSARLISPLTIKLGNECLGIMTDTLSLFELLYFLDETIMQQDYHFQLQYALVYGEIKTRINTEIAYDMFGPGLTRAHLLLEGRKPADTRHYIEIDPEKDESLHMCMKLHDAIRKEWKRPEFPVISAFIDQKDYKDMVDLGFYKNRSGAWKKRRSLRIEEYMTIKKLTFTLVRS